MIVRELVKKLSKMNQQAEVWHLWDGELRTEIEHVYMGKTGLCVTADAEMVAYSDEGRPVQAPGENEDEYWMTPPKQST